MTTKHSPAALEMARKILDIYQNVYVVEGQNVENIASIIDTANAELVKALVDMTNRLMKALVDDLYQVDGRRTWTLEDWGIHYPMLFADALAAIKKNSVPK